MVYWIRLCENKHREKNQVESHHHQIHQILYVLENKGIICLNNQSYLFTQDSLAFITPYSNHSITSNAKMTVLVLEFDLDKLDPQIKEILQQQGFDQSKIIKLNVFNARDVRQLLRRMLYEQFQGNAINQFALKTYLAELLLTLLRIRKESSFSDANKLRAERLRRYIDSHYFEVTDAAEIAHKFGISTRHINNIFKEQYNKTPMKYLNEVRIEMAIKLLLETNKDIASICFEVGFEAISTFYRRFKEYTELSPYKYRLKNQYSEME